jgi:TRAP-type C4-dicarboxylate transport system permease small subunit
MVAITVMIPVGVFFRYVLNAALSWPEPASTVMMVAFSFLGGAAVYRAKVHVAVEAVLNAVAPGVRRLMLWGVDLCMAAVALFMLVYGIHLCIVTWSNTLAEFPWLSVGLTYVPIPVAGLFTLLFLVERVWLGDPPKSDVMYSDQPAELE